MSWLGQRLPRIEDPRLLRGEGRFAGDVPLHRPLHMRLVRSTVAHGRITSIHTEPARLAGVVEVITAQTLRSTLGQVPRIPIRTPVDADLSHYLQPVLADGVVRYVGEPVAVVVAEDPYAAEDAASLVDVTVEELPPFVHATSATERDARPIHDDGNVAVVLEKGFGDVEGIFASAPVVVGTILSIGRHSGAPMEPRSLAVAYDPGSRRLDIWGVTKLPVVNRDILANLLGVPSGSIRIHAVDVGGGFGVRGEFYPEDFLAPFTALTTRRSVRWVEDRVEHLTAMNQSREQHHDIAIAFDRGGRILAVRDNVVHDHGAYMRTHGAAVPDQTIAMLLGPYRVPAYCGRVTVVMTNKTPTGTYRAPGRFEGNYVREHLLDLAADRLGIGRVELRARNLLRSDELPCERPLRHDGDTIRPDEGDYHRVLDLARRRWEEDGWSAELDRLRTAGRVVGMGFAFFLEHSGSRRFEAADVELDSTGSIRVATGGAQLGQGIETAMAQIVADVLSVQPAQVFVECGDSEQAPEGFGSFGSRSTVQAGSAVHGAAGTLRSTLMRVAAEALETDVRDLRMDNGRVHVVGMADVGLTFEQIAKLVQREPRFVRDDTIRLRERHRFELEVRTHPYGVQAAIVELDPSTGHVTCHRYLVAVEVGRAVNPSLIEGQVAGGVAQGLGGALMEEFRYDDAGQPLSSTFMDYQLPTALEVPVVVTLISEDAPALNNPLGIRGVGEAGICAVGAVMANAVRDALGDHEPVAALPIRPGAVLERLVRREDGSGPRRTA